MIILTTESTEMFILSRSDFFVKVEGQTNRGRLMDKKLAQVKRHTILSLTSHGGTNK